MLKTNFTVMIFKKEKLLKLHFSQFFYKLDMNAKYLEPRLKQSEEPETS